MSLAAGAFINFLPTNTWPGIPDFALLALCIWAVREGQMVGLGTAFILGVIVDVADAAVFGQHALAYVLATFSARELSRRILWFPLSLQALHIFPVFLVTLLIQGVIRYWIGDSNPHWSFYISAASSALLWMPVTILLLLPQLQPHERDENRPI